MKSNEKQLNNERRQNDMNKWQQEQCEIGGLDTPDSPFNRLSDSPPPIELSGPYDSASIQKMRQFHSCKMRAHEEHIAVADSSAEALRTKILQRLCAGDLDKKKVGQLWMELRDIKTENKLIRSEYEDLKKENFELEKQLAACGITNSEVIKTKEKQHVFPEPQTALRDIPSEIGCFPPVKPGLPIYKPSSTISQFAVPEVKAKKIKVSTRPSSSAQPSRLGTLLSDDAGSNITIRGRARPSPRITSTRRSRSVGPAIRGESPSRMFHNLRAYFEGKSKGQSIYKKAYQDFRF